MAAAQVPRPPLLARRSPPETHWSRPLRPNPARRRRRSERKAGDGAPAKAPELVMGKVTILKRGEALPQLPAPAVPATAAQAASPARKARADASYAGGNYVLSPLPTDVPMPIGLLENLILAH